MSHASSSLANWDGSQGGSFGDLTIIPTHPPITPPGAYSVHNATTRSRTVAWGSAKMMQNRSWQNYVEEPMASHIMPSGSNTDDVVSLSTTHESHQGPRSPENSYTHQAERVSPPKSDIDSGLFDGSLSSEDQDDDRAEEHPRTPAAMDEDATVETPESNRGQYDLSADVSFTSVYNELESRHRTNSPEIPITSSPARPIHRNPEPLFLPSCSPESSSVEIVPSEDELLPALRPRRHRRSKPFVLIPPFPRGKTRYDYEWRLPRLALERAKTWATHPDDYGADDPTFRNLRQQDDADDEWVPSISRAHKRKTAQPPKPTAQGSSRTAKRRQSAVDSRNGTRARQKRRKVDDEDSARQSSPEIEFVENPVPRKARNGDGSKSAPILLDEADPVASSASSIDDFTSALTPVSSATPGALLEEAANNAAATASNENCDEDGVYDSASRGQSQIPTTPRYDADRAGQPYSLSDSSDLDGFEVLEEIPIKPFEDATDSSRALKFSVDRTIRLMDIADDTNTTLGAGHLEDLEAYLKHVEKANVMVSCRLRSQLQQDVVAPVEPPPPEPEPDFDVHRPELSPFRMPSFQSTTEGGASFVMLGHAALPQHDDWLYSVAAMPGAENDAMQSLSAAGISQTDNMNGMTRNIDIFQHFMETNRIDGGSAVSLPQLDSHSLSHPSTSAYSSIAPSAIYTGTVDPSLLGGPPPVSLPAKEVDDLVLIQSPSTSFSHSFVLPYQEQQYHPHSDDEAYHSDGGNSSTDSSASEYGAEPRPADKSPIDQASPPRRKSARGRIPKQRWGSEASITFADNRSGPSQLPKVNMKLKQPKAKSAVDLRSIDVASSSTLREASVRSVSVRSFPLPDFTKTAARTKQPETGEESFCHQCRRKTRYPKMSCARYPCKLLFCVRCIDNRYPHIVFDASLRHWVCPSCEGVCNCTHHTRARGERYIGPRSRDPAIKGTKKPKQPKRSEKAPACGTQRRKRVTPSSIGEYESDDEAFGPEDAEIAPIVAYPEPGMSWGTVYLTSGQRAGTGIVALNNTVIVPGIDLRTKRKARGSKRLFIGSPLPGWRVLPLVDENPSDSLTHKPGDDLQQTTRRRLFVGNSAALRWRTRNPVPRLSLVPDPHEPRYDPQRSESPLTVISETDRDAEGETDVEFDPENHLPPADSIETTPASRESSGSVLPEGTLGNVIASALAAAVNKPVDGPSATV